MKARGSMFAVLFAFVFAFGWGLEIRPQAASQRVLIFPRLAKAQLSEYRKYANIDIFQAAYAFTNVGTSKAAITLTAYAETGAPLSGANIQNPMTLELEARNQIARYTTQLFGSGIAGKKASVEVVVSGGDVRGFYEYFDKDFNFLSGGPAINKTEASTRLMLPYAENINFDGKVEDTEVDIVNPNDVPANVQWRYWYPYGPNGENVNYLPGILKYQIPPHGKLQETGGSSQGAGKTYFEVVSDVPVVAAQVSLRNDGWDWDTRSVLSTRTIVAVNGISPSKALTTKSPSDVSLGVPLVHLTTVPGWYTNLMLWDIGNRNNTKTSGMLPFLDFWTKDGRPSYIGFRIDCQNNSCSGVNEVYIGRMQEVNSQTIIGLGFDGAVSYRAAFASHDPTQGLLVLAKFGDMALDDIGNPYQKKTFEGLIVPIDPTKYAVLAHVAEGEFGPDQFFGSGIAVRDARLTMNPQSDPTKNAVQLSLFSATGELLQTRSFELGSGEKLAMTHPQIFEGMAIPQFSGYVEISGTLPFKAFGLYWVSKGGKLAALSVIPPQ